MNLTRAKTYCKMEWKRGLRSIPLFFLVLLVTAGILVAAVAVSGIASGNSTALPKVDVAVVGSEGDAMTEKGIRMAGRLEVIKATTEFHYVSEKEADEGIEDGTFDAAIYLNDNMYEDINQGVNTPVHIRLARDGTISEKLFREMVEVGVYDLGTAESAIYAFYDLAEQYPTARRPLRIANKMASRFISLFLSRTSVWDDTMLSSNGEQTTAVYTTVTFELVFALLLGIGFAIFYTEEERTTGKALERLGVSALAQHAVKISVMTVSIWLFIQILTGLAMLVPALRSWPLFHPLGSWIPAFGMAVFVHFVYHFAKGPAAAFIYLICAAAMVVLAGGVVPIGQMPRPMAACVKLLPFAGWHQYLSALMGSGASQAATGIAVVITALVMLAVVGGVDLWQKKRGVS